MASTNQSPFYKKAEAKFLNAKSDEEKVGFLKEMIKECPKHKSSEKMLANLKTRLKKLENKIESKKKTKKAGSKSGIKKEGIQATLIGLTNSGKSSLLAELTNASPQIANFPYTTKTPKIGILNLDGIKIQIIDMPAVENELFEQGIAHTTDILLVLIEKISDIGEISPFLSKADGKKIIVFNKIDLMSEQEKRKILNTLKTKKYNFAMISTKTKQGIEELKTKIIEASKVMRIYTKEPRKPLTKEPIILPIGSNVKDVAEKIFHGLASQVKETILTGPSSKFPNQKVGLNHELKDKDIIEFHTK